MLQALQDMLSASQQDLEAFLTQVYRAIAGAAPLKDKVSPAVSLNTSYTKHAQSDASGVARQPALDSTYLAHVHVLQHSL